MPSTCWQPGQVVEVLDDSTSAKGEVWAQGQVVEYDEDAGLVCVEVNGETQYICEEDDAVNIRSTGGDDVQKEDAAQDAGVEDSTADSTAVDAALGCSSEPPEPPAIHETLGGPRNPTINGQPVAVSGEIFKKPTWRNDGVENPPECVQIEEAGEPVVEGLGLAFQDPNYNGKPWVGIYANLKYQVLREPDPHADCQLAVSMAKRTTMTCKAEAWMKSKKNEAEGGKFWSTREAGHCFTYKAGCEQVVKGWDKGCEGMRVGEIRRIHIPSNLGYGSKGNKQYEIPPNNDLVFEVECLFVRRFA